MPAKKEVVKAEPEAQLQTFVDKLEPKSQALFKSTRAALKKRFPTANELVYDYSFALVVAYAPADRGIDGIFAIRATADGVALYFSQGPKLPNPKRLLKGTGKQTRYVALSSVNELKDPDIEALISGTLEQARIPFAATGKGTLIIKSDNTTTAKKAHANAAKKVVNKAAKKAPMKAKKSVARVSKKSATKKAAKKSTKR